MNITTSETLNTEHKPGDFIIVGQTEYGVILHAMCLCGDDDCAFTTFASFNTMVHNAHKDGI